MPYSHLLYAWLTVCFWLYWMCVICICLSFHAIFSPVLLQSLPAWARVNVFEYADLIKDMSDNLSQISWRRDCSEYKHMLPSHHHSCRWNLQYILTYRWRWWTRHVCLDRRPFWPLRFVFHVAGGPGLSSAILAYGSDCQVRISTIRRWRKRWSDGFVGFAVPCVGWHLAMVCIFDCMNEYDLLWLRLSLLLLSPDSLAAHVAFSAVISVIFGTPTYTCANSYHVHWGGIFKRHNNIALASICHLPQFCSVL